MLKLNLIVLAAVVVVAAGCSKEKPAAPNAAPKTAPPTQGLAAGGLTGKVLETINSGGYTYVKLATGKGERWAAVRQTKLAKGSSVTIANAMEMKNFKSKTLDREFPSIYFGTLGSGQAAQRSPHAGMGGPHAGKGSPHAGMGGMNTMAGQKKVQSAHGKLKHAMAKLAKAVEKAPGAAGRRVAEVHAQRTRLNGKSVAVRGKVTKFNAGIMGRNWIHLQDGSGDAAKGDFDLTVTTKATVSVGDVVTVEGKAAADKDFGMGYRYSVIVEGAKVTK